MTRYTVEYEGGGHEEIEARSLRDAHRVARQRRDYTSSPGRGIIEIRPFAAKPRKVHVTEAPQITVKPDPFAVLVKLL